jgi:hypothetical protein
MFKIDLTKFVLTKQEREALIEAIDSHFATREEYCNEVEGEELEMYERLLTKLGASDDS